MTDAREDAPAVLADLPPEEQKSMGATLGELASLAAVGQAPDGERVIVATRRVLSPRWTVDFLTAYAVARFRTAKLPELKSIAAIQLAKEGSGVDSDNRAAAAAYIANEFGLELPRVFEHAESLGLNESFARYLEERLGDGVAADFVRSMEPKISPSEQLRAWVDASLISEKSGPPPALGYWLQALWRNRNQKTWAKFQKRAPAVAKAALDTSILRLSEIATLKSEQTSLPFVTPPAGLDETLFHRLALAEKQLTSLTWFRFLEWLIRTGHECETLHHGGAHCRLEDGHFRLTQSEPSATSVSVTIPGGYRTLAEKLGFRSEHDAVTVRNLVHYLALNEFQFGHGRRGNLLAYHETDPSPGRQAELYLSILRPLLPSQAQEYAKKGGLRRLVPIYDAEPVLTSIRDNEKGKALGLFLAGLSEFRGQARRLEANQSVLVNWGGLGTRFGLSPRLALRAVDVWAESGDLAKHGDAWTLGPRQPRALRFILDGAKMERSGAEHGDRFRRKK